jgi:hypothetical protein
MHDTGEEGQAILIVVLAMGIFLLGAVGLAIDGSHLFSQRQMAQSAADSAAIAGIMSIFDGTNTTGAHSFSTGASFNCTTTDARTPCVYAAKNAFGATAADTVTIDFPTTAPGVSLSASYPTALVRATVSRNVPTTLMRMITPTTFTTVTATATAAIVDIFAPIPIIVLHPTLTDAFQLQGNPNITICGGPTKSIQVNSAASEDSHLAGSAHIDLSHAGPKDTAGDCTLGTGSDFGLWGGSYPTDPTSIVSLGSTGHYVNPASPIKDPLASVNPPPIPALAPGQTSLSAGATSGGVTCPVSAGVKGCTVWSPGKYPSGISATNTTMLMKPGIYYMVTGGFSCASNCNITTITGSDTGPGSTNTGWDGTKAGGGVLVYNSGTGPVNIGSNGTAYMIGSPATSAYKGILFFEDRAAPANISPPIKNANSLGGGGAMTLIGTLYFTNAGITTSTHYQELRLSGNSGSGTLVQGEIIADSLTLGGGGNITMNLNPAATLIVPQVALVQ